MAVRFPHWAIAAALAVCVAPRSIEAALDDRTPLNPGVAVEREIDAGDRHAYTIPVNGGETLKIAVDQLGADVIVDAGLDRAAATADDVDKHHYGRELLVWPAPSSGVVTIGVRAKSIVPSAGRYRVTVTVYPVDAALAAAAFAFNDGLRLARAPGSDRPSHEQEAAKLQQTLDAWRQVGDRELLAASLARLARGEAVVPLSRPSDALPLAADAVAIYDELQQPTELVGALLALATAQVATGQADAALATLERAYQHTGDTDPLVRAAVEDDMARTLVDTDPDRAVSVGERAVAAFHDAGAFQDESYALERLSLAYSRLARLDDALAAMNQAIALGRKYGRDNDVATMTMSIGRIQTAASDDDAALETFRDALAMFKGQATNRIITQLAMGRIYDRRGDGARARPILEEALDHVPPQLTDLWAAVATELGTSLNLTGDATRALDLQRRALQIVEASGSRVPQLTVLRDIAATYRALGDIAAAERAVDRARDIGAQVAGSPYAAMILRERARNARAAGDLPGARQALDEALRIVESERGRLQSEALRASFGGTLQDYYNDAIALALQMHAVAPEDGHDARAFELFERSRARSLADLLTERRVSVTTTADAALVDEQRSLQRQLAAKDSALRNLDLKNRPHAAAIEQDVVDIERRLAVLDGQIRASNPEYAALAHPAPATLADTQQLLDERTVLLALDVGATSCGWAITRSAIHAFVLPPAVQIDEQARRLYADVEARQRPGAGGAADLDRALVRDAGALSDLVLGPIADRLAGEWRTSRLAIVATGSLEYVPFAALPAPRAAHVTNSPRAWLVDRHELMQLPSVSVLALLRNQPLRTSVPGVAVLADAVYSADDPRVRAAAVRSNERASDPPAGDPVLRGIALGRTRGGLSRLVFSREEANAIVGLAPRSSVFEALDFAASLRTIASPPVARKRIVHIASHGIFNTARPELSGLVLSLVDEQGRPEEGVLHLYDVANLKLSADLVVLSGCQTGLGRQLRGEGLIGISRAFMYAGASHVVATLWAVDDLATAELMRRFYHALLVEKLTPAAALVSAQRQLRADPRWRSPFYWAGFTLVGDWR